MSHHVQGSLSADDCEVCHAAETDGTYHQNGYVNLSDPDTSSTIYTETIPGAFRPVSVTVSDIGTLTTFCENCHDGDGADGDTTPFSGAGTAITATVHANTDFGAAIEGDFETGCIQCHAGHGSSNLSIIQSSVVVTAGVTTGPVVFTALTGSDSSEMML